MFLAASCRRSTARGLEKVVLESTLGAQPGERCGDLNVLYDFEQGGRLQGVHCGPSQRLRASSRMSLRGLRSPLSSAQGSDNCLNYRRQIATHDQPGGEQALGVRQRHACLVEEALLNLIETHFRPSHNLRSPFH